MIKNSIHRGIIKLALPAIAGSSAQMIVSLIDTAMIGRIEEAKFALAAMGLGVVATWALISFFSSFATGTHVLVARRFGEKDFEGCGNILVSSLITAFLIGLFVALVGVSSSHYIGQFFAADEAVGNYAGEYLFFRLMSIPFFLLTVSYRGFFFGIGKTKIFMFSAILVNILNIIFNYIFIYGAFGAPRMGLAGAGLGSTLATVCDSGFYFSVTLIYRYRTKYKYFTKPKDIIKIFKSILKISLPVSFQNIFLLLGFLSFIAITGIIGTEEQAAAQVIMSSLFISLMPCFGFGIAIQTLVGNNLGSNKINIAKIYTIETAKIASLYTLFVGVIFIVFPKVILILLTTNRDVINIAAPSLQIAGFAQIFYAAAIVFANALQAAGKTIFVMFSELFSNIFLFVPISYILGVYLQYGLIGAWSALIFYIVPFFIINFLRFRYGDWNNLKKL